MNDANQKMRRRQRLLVIDNDPSLGLLARDLFAREPMEVLTADNGAAGVELVRARRPDVILLEHFLPDANGLEVFDAIRACDPRLPVIWVTRSACSETAIEAMRAGAFDFLTKPADIDRLVRQVQHAIDSRQLMLMPVEIDGATANKFTADALLGRSAGMQEVYKAIGRLTAVEVPVLLIGESGTGKQLTARTLYQHGRRSDKPFLHVRCRDYAAGQLAVRLFGEQLADGTTRPGDVERAAGGTLLLEHLAAIDLATQTRLLHLVQQHVFQRVGGDASVAADVAIIISTQDDPELLLRSHLLHSDFYFLFSSYSIALPPLRDRKEDLPLLIDHFIRAYSNIHKSFGADLTRVSAEALALLQDYTWPGNVAELQSVVRRALMETKGTVLASDYLHQVLRTPSSSRDIDAAPVVLENAITDWTRFVAERIAQQSTNVYADSMAEMEAHIIREVMAHTRGNQAQAAKILGITRTSLRKRVLAFGNLVSRAAAS